VRHTSSINLLYYLRNIGSTAVKREPLNTPPKTSQRQQPLYRCLFLMDVSMDIAGVAVPTPLSTMARLFQSKDPSVRCYRPPFQSRSAAGYMLVERSNATLFKRGTQASLLKWQSQRTTIFNPKIYGWNQ
jgi:hypothetical protein